MEFLIEEGAAVSTTSELGNTPLSLAQDVAEMYPEFEKIAERLERELETHRRP